MTSLAQLPNIAASFQKVKIGIDLERASGRGESIIHLAIQRSFLKKRPIGELIAWVKSQAQDNPDLMAETIGDDLTCRILKFNEA